jgi:hypothetical protein
MDELSQGLASSHAPSHELAKDERSSRLARSAARDPPLTLLVYANPPPLP